MDEYSSWFSLDYSGSYIFREPDGEGCGFYGSLSGNGVDISFFNYVRSQDGYTPIRPFEFKR